MDKNFKQQLMAYMAGNFTCRDQRLRFQMHMGLCFACRNYMRQMKYTVATLRKLPSEPVPAHVKEELLKRFRTWKQEQSSQVSPSDLQ
jgi:anti-sigma factor RsiW